jgi:hypothetical protein
VPGGRGAGNLKEKALCTSQNKIREERCEGQHGFRASTTDRVQADQCAKRKVICLSNACASSQVMEMLLASVRAVATRGVSIRLQGRATAPSRVHTASVVGYR